MIVITCDDKRYVYTPPPRRRGDVVKVQHILFSRTNKYRSVNDAMLVWLLAALLVLLLLTYAKRRYFTLRHGLPGLSPHFYVGNLVQSGILFRGTSLSHVLVQFQKKFGDNFQFWLGPARFMVIGDIADVQHIFNHRHIYDQGDVFIEKISLLFPDGLGCIKGQN